MALENKDQRQIRKYEKVHQSRVEQETRKGIISRQCSKLFSKLVEARRKGKGFFNRKGGIINWHEAHAAGWGLLLMELYFTLSKGVFLALYIGGIGWAWRNPVSEEHSSTTAYFKSEIMNNIHYYLLFGFLSAFRWVVILDVSPPPVDKGLIASLLGAAFGL